MKQSNDAKTTKRDSNRDIIQEGGLPKDKETAEAGDNRGTNGDVDGNAHAAGKRSPRR
jgi:hypothetical protein